MVALSRRGFICGAAAVAALATMPAIAATGVKTLSKGRTEVNLAANPALANVGGVVEVNIKKYGRVAVVRTSSQQKVFQYLIFHVHMLELESHNLQAVGFVQAQEDMDLSSH